MSDLTRLDHIPSPRVTATDIAHVTRLALREDVFDVLRPDLVETTP